MRYSTFITQWFPGFTNVPAMQNKPVMEEMDMVFWNDFH
jgi:hypothetical protein